MNLQIAPLVVGSSLLLGACILVALWLLAKRIRTWKEQILQAVSISESNNAQAHDVTRTMFWKNREAIVAQLATLDETLTAQNSSLQKKIAEQRKQIEFQALARERGAQERSREVSKPANRYDEILRFLNSLDYSESSHQYLAIHQHRIARTLDLVPPPYKTNRVLELGAYMHMTPALQCVLGYQEVRGAYKGNLGERQVQTVQRGAEEIFSCVLDLFNVETDKFPYPDEYFDTVLGCELIEHLAWDPAHMILECSRVLAQEGTLILTTPNVASGTSIQRVLRGEVNPQIYSHYPAAKSETPHIREYTAIELRNLLECCGFHIEYLFTEPSGSEGTSELVAKMLVEFGLPTDFRGEQIYCVARKSAPGELTRRPQFLYE